MGKIRPEIKIACLLGVAALSQTAPGLLHGDEQKSTLEQDIYSGKTVATKEMAYDMIDFRQKNAPRVGEIAPGFELISTEGKRISLDQLSKEKPVVLVMSSWGCDIFRESLAGLQALYTEYSREYQFAMIYIREAHHLEGFGGSLGRTYDSVTTRERIETARRCQEQLRLLFPVLVDSVDDPVTTRWAAWPVRVFVVGTDRKILYAGAQGPWGYRPYQGFVHGDGERIGWDLKFSPEIVEEFLQAHRSRTKKVSAY